jgi:dGTPase
VFLQFTDSKELAVQPSNWSFFFWARMSSPASGPHEVGVSFCWTFPAFGIKQRKIKWDTKIPERRGEDTPLTKGYYASEEKLVETVKKNVLQGYKLKKEEKFRTIEMQIMDMADDISYSTYDFEDAMKAGFISPIELIAKVNNNNELVGEVAKKLFAEELGRPYPKSNQSQSDKAKFEELRQKAVEVVAIMFLDIFKEAIPPQFHKDLNKKRPKGEWETITTLFAYLSTVRAETLSKAIQENGYNRSYFTSRLVGKRIRSLTIEPHQLCPPLSVVKIPTEMQFEISTLKHLTYEIQINA